MREVRADTETHHQPVVMGEAKRSGRMSFMDLNIAPRRRLMHRAVTNFILPALSISMILLVTVFPSPAALNMAVREVTSPFRAKAEASIRGATDATFIVEDYARLVPGLTSQLQANADCFVGLDAATADRLEECAPAVTAIIAQIVQYQDNPVVARALEEQDGRLLPQIQVAATEICRSLWSTGSNSADFLDDPSCLMAQVTLATDRALR